MGLPFVRPGLRVMPADLAAWWDRYFRGVEVTPDNQSVTTEKIVDDAVTNEKLRNSAAYSVMGRAGNSAGNPADISASADRQVLVRRASGLAFEAIQDADLPSTIARDTEVAAAIAAHQADSDPHPVYTTAAELAAAIAVVTAKLPTIGGDYADDTAAAAGGVPVGSMYHTSGAVKIRRT